MKAAYNVSDVMTKLTLDPIKICNSSTWRNGHSVFTDEDEMEKNTFYKVSFNLREYSPLPDHLTGIEQNLQAAVALNKSYDSVSKEGDGASMELETQNQTEKIMMVTTRSNKKKKESDLSHQSSSKALPEERDKEETMETPLDPQPEKLLNNLSPKNDARKKGIA